MTLATQAVLRVLLEEPGQEMYGLQICTAAGLPSSTVHPILARLDDLGWLESRWEDEDPCEKGRREQGRPRRRYYRLPCGRSRAGPTCPGTKRCGLTCITWRTGRSPLT